MATEVTHTAKPTRRQTVQQKRAAFAWKKVNEIKEEQRADYLTLVRGAPAMITANGLGSTLAFLRSRKGTKKTLYYHLQEWLCDGDRPLLPAAGGEQHGDDRLVKRLIACDSARYRHATIEALAVLNWLKPFAEATTEGDDGDAA